MIYFATMLLFLCPCSLESRKIICDKVIVIVYVQEWHSTRRIHSCELPVSRFHFLCHPQSCRFHWWFITMRANHWWCGAGRIYLPDSFVCQNRSELLTGFSVLFSFVVAFNCSMISASLSPTQSISYFVPWSSNGPKWIGYSLNDADISLSTVSVT